MSLEAQKEAIQNFADRNDLQIIQWYEEKETAAKSGRPIFADMLKQLRAGNASGLIIHKIDRSARNFADWARIGELSDSGIDVHFAAESIDFRSRGGRLTADIQAVIAADYIRNLREETLKGIHGRLKQGLYPFRAPIGYVDNGGGKVKTIDPIAGPLVKELFEAYASGEHSLRSLVELADQIALRSPSGQPIGKTCIEKMLANPFYIGIIHIVARGQCYEGIHEPLITPNVFRSVERVRAGKTVKKCVRHNLQFRRIFKCARCKGSIIGEIQKGNEYYRCHTNSCTSGTLRAGSIGKAIEDRIFSLKLSPHAEYAIAERISNWNHGRGIEDEKQKFRLAIEKLKIRERNCLDALIDGLIDKPTYEERHLELLREKKANEEKCRQIDEQSSRHISATKFLELFKNLYFTYQSANFGERRQLLEIMFSNRLADGKKLILEPRNLIIEAQNQVCVLLSTPSKDTNRNPSDAQKHQSQDLQRLPNDQEIKALESLNDIWMSEEIQTLWSIQQKYCSQNKQKKQ